MPRNSRPTAEPTAMPRTPTPAQLARSFAGLSREEAAKRIGITKAYLSRMEKQGSFNYPLAQRFARVYGCPVDVFIYCYKSDPLEGAKGAYRKTSRSQKRREGKGEGRDAALPKPSRRDESDSSLKAGETL